jgi:hypothetical protein
MSIYDDFNGLRPTVMWFANEMEGVLQSNDFKTGWNQLSQKMLLHRLKQEVKELERALEKDMFIVIECCDIANFAMMIADNHVSKKEELSEIEDGD